MSPKQLAVHAIDVGGTDTKVSVVSQTGKVLIKDKFASNDTSFCSQDEYMQKIVSILQKQRESFDKNLSNTYKLCGIGIGVPGQLDLKRKVIENAANNPLFHNLSIVKAIRTLYANLPIYMDNDANACILAEQRWGKYHSYDNMIYLTYSTGMGAGLWVNGKLLRGTTNNAGEVGHMILNTNPNASVCGCGQRGCWESEVGKENFEKEIKHYQETLGDDATFTAQEILTSTKNEPHKRFYYNVLVSNVAHGIGNLIMTLNPSVILLGTAAKIGGAKHLKDIKTSLETRFHAWPIPIHACKLDISSLENIGDLGAACIAFNELNI